MSDEKKTLEIADLKAYNEVLLQCRKCVNQYLCRGPWVYEPWCPKDFKFEERPKE